MNKPVMRFNIIGNHLINPDPNGMYVRHEDYAEARAAVLDQAAAVVRDHNKVGRGWIPGSLWDTLANEAAARVLALKGKP